MDNQPELDLTKLREMIEAALENAEELTMYGRDLCRELRQISAALHLEEIKK